MSTVPGLVSPGTPFESTIALMKPNVNVPLEAALVPSTIVNGIACGAELSLTSNPLPITHYGVNRESFNRFRFE